MPTSIDGKTAGELRFFGVTYYQGRPCKHGHSGLRYSSNRSCVQCHEQRAPGTRHRKLTRQIKRMADRIEAMQRHINRLEEERERTD